jgi:hypothetical protein
MQKIQEAKIIPWPILNQPYFYEMIAGVKPDVSPSGYGRIIGVSWFQGSTPSAHHFLCIERLKNPFKISRRYSRTNV